MNPESEISSAEAREPKVDPRPGDQDAVSSPAKEPAPSPTSGPDPAPSQRKPKRKYRSSEKVRASSPANLKQARKAYVFTPAREAASMKNLEKANAAPPEKRNRFTQRRLLARYANLCLAHLKLGPPGKRSPNHIHSGTSCRHLEHSLALAGEDKAKLEAHRDRFQRAFRPRDREERRLVRGMADAAWRLLRSFGVRNRWEMRAVQYRLMLAIHWRQAGKRMEPGDAGSMALHLLLELGDLARLQEERQLLQKRLEQLLRAFLSHRRGAPSSFWFFTKLGSRLPDFEALPDFALGNPFVSPGQARKAAEQEAAGAKELKAAKDWAGSGTEDNRKKRGPARRLSEEEKLVRDQLLRAMGSDDALDEAGLERMLAQAFGIYPAGRDPSSISKLAGTLWKRLRLLRDWRDSAAGDLDDILEQASGPQGVETWEPQPPRGRILKSGWPREADDQSPHWQWRALAALLLAVFACEIDWVDEARVLTKRLHGAFYSFLAWHYQYHAGFEAPQPDVKYSWAPAPPGAWGVYLREQYAHGVQVTVRRE